jgi:photosystem II stability/assembly factor-like uncharacterized protein
MTRGILTGLLLMIAALAGAQNYTALNGPFGGSPTKLITNANGDLLAIQRYGGAGLMMSQDGGANWTAVSVTSQNEYGLNDIFYDASNGKIYAVSYNRFYTSSDGGSTWVLTAQTGFINGMFIAKGPAGGLFLVGGNGINTVYRSLNNGGTWSVRFDAFTTSNIRDFKITSGGFIFIATSQGVYKGAESEFTPPLPISAASGLTDTDFFSLLLNGTDLYALSSTKPFKSVNNGTTWTEVTTGLTDNFYNCFMGKDPSGNIYIATPFNVWTSTNAGISWSSVTSPMPSTYYVSPTCAYFGSASTWLVGYSSRALYKTTDGGANWTNSSNQYTGLRNTQILIADNSWILIPGDYPYGHYISTDDGLSFDFVGSSGLAQRQTRAFMKVGANIWGYGSGIILSTNNGSSWTEVHDGSIFFNKIVSNDGNTMYAFDRYYDATPEFGLWKSTGGGATGTWTRTDITGTGFPGNATGWAEEKNFILDSNGNLLLLTYTNATQKYEVWKIDATTAVATKVTVPGTASINDVETHNGKWYALANDNKLHISSNQGANWTTKTAPIGWENLKIINDNTFYILNQQVHISTDGGDTWVNTGTLGGNYYIEDVAISSANYSYVPVPYGKVLKSNAVVVPPNPPTNLAIFGRSAFIVGLKFDDNSNNETYFILERSEGNNTSYDSIRQVFSSGTYGLVATAPASENTLTYYRVRAVGPAGKSAYSNEVSLTTPANCTTYTIPTGRSWTGTTQNLSGMGVFTNSTVLITGGNGLYNINNLTVGWGGSGQGISPFFSNPNAVTGQIFELCGDVFFPQSPQFPRIIGNDQGSWDPNTNTLTINFQTSPTISPSKQERVVFTLNAADPVPAAVTASAFIKTQTEISVTWSLAQFATQYQVQRSTTSGSGFVDVGSPTNLPIYVDTGLSAGTTYYYQVKAISVGGDFIDAAKHSTSAEVSIQLQVPLFEALSISQSDFATQGVAWLDIDNDNDDDLLVTPFNAPAGQSIGVYENVSGQLQRISVPGVTDHPILSVATASTARDISVGDLNNDGLLDFSAQGSQTGGEVYVNKGNKEFERTSLVPPNNFGLSWYASLADFNNDGRLDAVFSDDVTDQVTFVTTTAFRFFTQNGSGELEPYELGEIVAENKVSRGGSWADYDNDGDQDFLRSRFGTTPAEFDQLYTNNGDGSFTPVTGTAFEADANLGSRSMSWGDFDNDLDLDVFIVNNVGALNNMLYQNNGDGTFTRLTTSLLAEAKTVQSFGSAWGDIDNDGDLDMVVANGLQSFLYLNNGLGIFTRYAGNEYLVASDASRTNIAFAFSDYDNNGTLDIAAGKTLAGFPTILLKNSLAIGANTKWLKIKLVGTVSNRAGIGARVIITMADTKKQMRHISSESGYGSASSLIAHFGLKNNATVAKIEVFWPSGIHQVINSPTAANQQITITEDGTGPAVTTLLPVNGQVDVGALPTVELTLDEASTPVANKKITIYKGNGTTDIAFQANVTTATPSGNKYTFTLANKLSPSNQYRVVVDDGAFIDAFGNPTGPIGVATTDPQWIFNTASGPIPTSQVPAPGAVNVHTNTVIEITFGTTTAATAGKSVRVYKAGVANPIHTLDAASATASPGNKFTFTLTSKLEINTDYALGADAGTFVTSLGFESGQLDPTPGPNAWTFKTNPGPDITAISPLNLATDVAVAAPLEITFNRNVTAVPGKKLFINDGSSTTEVLVATAGAVIDNKFTLSHAATAFPYHKTLGISIEPGAFIDQNQNDFKGLSVGNWSFTTVEAPDVTDPVITLDLTPLTALEKGYSPFTYSMTVADNKSVASVNFFRRKISEKNFTSTPATLNTTTQKWEVQIANTFGDEMGFEFYVEARDPSNNDARSPADPTKYHRSSIKFVGANRPTVPVPSGGTKTSWKIISIPHTLATSQISQVFAVLNEASATTWRMLHYQHEPKKWLEYPANFQTVDRGKGYFLNSVTGGTVTLVDPAAPDGTRDNLFSMTLKKGWNQIGNPYTVTVNWNDVIAFNNAAANVGPLHLFVNGTYAPNPELLVGSGGFVLAQNDATINISFPGQTAAGGRVPGYEYGPLGSDHWMVPITLKQGDASSVYGGVGMSAAASDQFDEQDGFNPPRFFDFAEINFSHPEHFLGRFSRDIVNLRDEHEWEFTFDSNVQGVATLTWDNSSFGNGDEDLFLFDVASQMPVNMRETTEYSFDPAQSKIFKVFFGRNLSQKLKANRVLLGNAFPNPMSASTTIPFALPENNSSFRVQVEVFDVMGRKIETILDKELAPGYYQAEWSPADKPEDGIYIYKLSAANSSTNEVISGKIIFKK